MAIDFQQTAPGGTYNKGINPYLKGEMSDGLHDAQSSAMYTAKLAIGKYVGDRVAGGRAGYSRDQEEPAAVPVAPAPGADPAAGAAPGAAPGSPQDPLAWATPPGTTGTNVDHVG